MSLALLRAVLPKVPALLTGTASHLLSLNPHSQHWDLRTFLTVAVLQSFLAGSGSGHRDRKGREMTVEQVQKMVNKEQEVEDDNWISKVAMPLEGVVSEEEVRLLEEMVDRAVRELGGEGMRVEKARVGGGVLTGEWSGWRNVGRRGTYQKVEEVGEVWDERRKFEALKEDVREPQAEEGVVLWIHGGKF